MTDGRVTGPNGEIFQEDMKKYKEISPKQFIAFAGHKGICEDIVNMIDFTENYYDMLDIANQIFTIIKQEKYKNVDLLFAIGGLQVTEIFFCAVDNKNGVFLFKPIDDEEPLYIFNNPREDIDLEEKFQKLRELTGDNTADSCLKAQKLFNDFVAGIDVTVNTTTFELTIEK